MGMRRLDDGSFVLIRANSELEALYNRTMIRVPGQLKWFPKGTGKDVQELKDRFKDCHAYLIGKGPSLDNLKESDFKEGCPIFCINESIKKINTLSLKNLIFVIQQDCDLRETCRPNPGGTMIVSHNAHLFYEDTEKYVFSAVKLGLDDSALSALCAVEILKLCGITEVTLYCFDACTTLDTGYASIIGYSPTKAGDPKRFLTHRIRIDAQFGTLKHNWMLPIPFEQKLAICAILKNEDDYIEEWIEHHRLIGVTHFYLYLNDWECPKLKRYVDLGLVTINKVSGNAKQLASYNHCLSKYGHLAEWIAFIDCDEFLDTNDGQDFYQMLQSYTDFDGLVLPWTIYGSNGHEKKTEGLVTERFTKCAKKLNQHVKVILRNKKVFFKFQPHNVESDEIVNEAKVRVRGPYDKNPVKRIFVLKHYFVKSREEFNLKVNRGRADIPELRKLSEFEVMDCNEVDSHYPNIYKLKERLQPDITLITCTGDRQEAFNLCERWIKAQTYSGRIQWIVVDDGVTPTITTMEQEVYHRIGLPSDPAHTLIPNLRVALPHVRGKKIFLIEDDDYYTSNYIVTYLSEFQNFQLIGASNSRYYNPVERKWIQYSNDEHASLCQTAFDSSLLPIFKELCEDDDPIIDIRFFKVVNKRQKHLFNRDVPVCVGIKGMPGRKGIYSGHSKFNGFYDDPRFEILLNWIGHDANEYRGFFTV